MLLVISDTSIIIDMHAGGVLEEMFRLTDIDFAVPDVLYLEELTEHHARLPGLGLQVFSLSGDAVADVIGLRKKYGKPSQNDLFALALARERACSLLTGDASLRAAAKAEHIDTHGTLWLIDRMLEQGIVDIDLIDEAYGRMRTDGSYLPWDLVTVQVARWRAKAA